MRTQQDDKHPDFGPPLWSIGLLVALMFIVPIVLYSVAPAGPIREGDTVFSNGQNHVTLAQPRLFDKTKYEGSCLLDPHSPLVVLQQPVERPDASILAQVQGAAGTEWPFCPTLAEVVVGRQQIVQKTDPLGEIPASLARIFGK